jgi:ADP-ribose pyrophosphatase
MNTKDDLPIWTIDSSKYAVNDKFMRLRVDSCTTPAGGTVNKYYVIECGDWVNCLAIDTENNAIILRHYRHGVQKYLSEFIGGSIEPEDASPESAARRELEEEAGYTGGTLYPIGIGYPNPANHTNKVYSFLAVGGKIDKEQNLEVGESIVVEKIPFSTVLKQMSSPEQTYPSMYVAAMFYAVNFIRASSDPSLHQTLTLKAHLRSSAQQLRCSPASHHFEFEP